jgi:hypothetical protein
MAEISRPIWKGGAVVSARARRGCRSGTVAAPLVQYGRAALFFGTLG